MESNDIYQEIESIEKYIHTQIKAIDEQISMLNSKIYEQNIYRKRWLEKLSECVELKTKYNKIGE